jgi:hypothetical protein
MTVAESIIDKASLLKRLSKLPSSTRLELLSAAYDAMNERQRLAVFRDHTALEEPVPVDGKKLLQKIKQFRRDSLDGKYYAPFNVNSKNWTHLPNETETWFSELGQFLADSMALTKQGDHARAAACFGLLYELILAMEYGKEIVFADELGSWMIPVEGKKAVAAYLKSLAATTLPEQYATVATPLIKRDSYQNFTDQAYTSALRAADKAQKAHLLAEIERQQIKTESAKPMRRAKRGTKS